MDPYATHLIKSNDTPVHQVIGRDITRAGTTMTSGLVLWLYFSRSNKINKFILPMTFKKFIFLMWIIYHNTLNIYQYEPANFSDQFYLSSFISGVSVHLSVSTYTGGWQVYPVYPHIGGGRCTPVYLHIYGGGRYTSVCPQIRGFVGAP